jgi:hypothetical protein
MAGCRFDCGLTTCIDKKTARVKGGPCHCRYNAPSPSANSQTPYAMASPGPAYGVPYGFDSDYEAGLYGELEVWVKPRETRQRVSSQLF